MLVNLLPNPWQNTTLMILLAGPPYSERMNKEKSLRKVIKTSKLLDNQHENAIDKINFHLDVGQGRAEPIMSYVEILDHLDHQEQKENCTSLGPSQAIKDLSHIKMRITKAAKKMSW